MTIAERKVFTQRIAERIYDGVEHTAKDLAWYAMIYEQNDTYPITRDLVREMIEDGHLIGSTSKGYKIMSTGKEVQQCLNSLLKRTIGINKRIQNIYNAAQKKGIL
jgi:hypothetical protein